jgi:hypothetical protein
MQHTVSYQALPFDFKKHTLIANSQSIFGCEIGQFLHIPDKTGLHGFNPYNDAPLI